MSVFFSQPVARLFPLPLGPPVPLAFFSLRDGSPKGPASSGMPVMASFSRFAG